VTAVEQRQ